MRAPIRLSLSVAFVAVILGCVNVASAPIASASAGVCDLVAAPNGSDTAPGTIGAPFQTVQHLVDSLQPGQTGCLRAGVYEEDVTMRQGGTAAAPVVVRSYAGETATLVGRLRLAEGSDYTEIEDLNLVGIEHGHDCATMCASPTVDANHTTWSGDDVTNDHANAICFLLGDSHGVYGTANYTTIEGDRIHDCGALPATNYDHGIYVEESYGSKIVDDEIYDNSDRGIQLYPQAVDTLIRGDVITGNGEGVDFGADGPQSSDDNLVEDDIIANSNVLYNVMSAYGPGDQVGTGNVVRHNCIGGGAYDNAGNPGGVRFDHSGFQLEGNVLAKPTYVNAAQADFLPSTGSRCSGILGPSAFAGLEAMTVEHPAGPGRGLSLGGGMAVTIRAYWASRGGRRVLRIDGLLVRRGERAHVAALRCQAGRQVIMRMLRGGKWVDVASGRTRANCTFTAADRLGASKRVRLEAVVAGVGRSNVLTIRPRPHV